MSKAKCAYCGRTVKNMVGLRICRRCLRNIKK